MNKLITYLIAALVILGVVTANILGGYSFLKIDTETKGGWIEIGGANAKDLFINSNVSIRSHIGERTGDLKIGNLMGIGKAYVCVKEDGVLFRSKLPCV